MNDPVARSPGARAAAGKFDSGPGAICIAGAGGLFLGLRLQTGDLVLYDKFLLLKAGYLNVVRMRSVILVIQGFFEILVLRPEVFDPLLQTHMQFLLLNF